MSVSVFFLHCSIKREFCSIIEMNFVTKQAILKDIGPSKFSYLNNTTIHSISGEKNTQKTCKPKKTMQPCDWGGYCDFIRRRRAFLHGVSGVALRVVTMRPCVSKNYLFLILIVILLNFSGTDLILSSHCALDGSRMKNEGQSGLMFSGWTSTFNIIFFVTFFKVSQKLCLFVI